MHFVTGRSCIAEHYWVFLPGSRAKLKHERGDVMATIHSPEICLHIWVEAQTSYDKLHDAQRAIERSVAGIET